MFRLKCSGDEVLGLRVVNDEGIRALLGLQQVAFGQADTEKLLVRGPLGYYAMSATEQKPMTK